MSYVKLRRNGIFEIYDEHDTFVKVISKQHLFRYMLRPIRLEAGITLGEAIQAAPDQIWDVMPWDFSEHLKELQKPSFRKGPGDEDAIEYLEILQTVIIDDGESYDPEAKAKRKVVDAHGNDIDDIFKDLPPLKKEDMRSVEIYPTFHGISYPKTKDDTLNGWTKGDVIPYGIGFTPLNELKDIPIKIKHRNEAYLCINKERKVVVTSDDYSFNPSVLDFYYHIVYELTWYGPPEQRDETIKELRETVDEIRNEEKANEGPEDSKE